MQRPSRRAPISIRGPRLMVLLTVKAPTEWPRIGKQCVQVKLFWVLGRVLPNVSKGKCSSRIVWGIHTAWRIHKHMWVEQRQGWATTQPLRWCSRAVMDWPSTTPTPTPHTYPRNSKLRWMRVTRHSNCGTQAPSATKIDSSSPQISKTPVRLLATGRSMEMQCLAKTPTMLRYRIRTYLIRGRVFTGMARGIIMKIP